ncbi:MAG: PucR family transcriptional regulator [Solirubrobacterales bacterium]|nr:PucR family transcriptional regulator [Solirubrobacterales bacterium]
MGLTLGELLDQPAFGLRLRAGGEGALARPIEGVHCLELLDPVPWLQEGWVMLTAGAQLRDGEAAQRLMVQRLAAGGIAAMGFGIGAFMPDVPDALLDEAEQRGFPVFTSPYETPFREIVTYVNQSILSHDLYVLRRLTWMQQYLLDALHEPAADQVLVDRLSGLLDGAAAAHVDIGGRPIAAAGATPGWSEVASYCDPRGIRETEIDGRWTAIAPVHDGAGPESWLVVAARARPLDRQLTKPLLQTAINLLALLASTRRAAVRSRLDSRRRVAARVARAARGERDPALTAELAAEGVDFAEPCRLALGALRDGGEARDGEAALGAFDGFVLVNGIDAVVAADGGRAAMLAQSNLEDLGSWLAAQDGPPLAVGLSRPLRSVEGIAAAFEQAELALAAAAGLPAGRAAVRCYDDLDPEVLVVGELGSSVARARLGEFVAPLLDQPRLLEAVEAYLAAELDIGRAAAALHLHRNSLRNRLTRAEELLGRPLKSPATIASLHLALVAANLGDRPPAIGASSTAPALSPPNGTEDLPQ